MSISSIRRLLAVCWPWWRGWHVGIVIAICCVNADIARFIDGSVWAAQSLYWWGSDCRFCRLFPRRCDYIDHFVCSVLRQWRYCAWMRYRYAATDCATEEERPKAISYVLAGGLMAAYLAQKLPAIRWWCRIIFMPAVISRYLRCSLFHYSH